MIKYEYHSIKTADILEILARLDELDDYLYDASVNGRHAEFPVHDALSGEDNDAPWNDYWELEQEVKRRDASI